MALPDNQTKTDFVRKTLSDIGALTKNPPKGWRKQVEDALAAHNEKMHQVTIYQIRSTLMEQNGSKSKRAKPAQSGNAEVKPVKQVPNLNLGQLQEVKTFAEKFGGLAGLAEAVTTLQKVSEIVTL